MTTAPQAWKSLQQKQRHPATHKWFLGIFVVVLVFYGTAGYIATSQVIGDHRSWREFIARPTDFGLRAEVASFNSQDGIPLKGWWLPAEGPAHWNLILVHGKDGNRSHMLSRANFLVRNGYNVLAIDLRDHGESGGWYITAGYLEARDIFGAVGYLRQRGERAPIALLGHSYGAVAALRATADSPEIAAVISDGAFASSKQMLDNVTRYYMHSSSTPLWAKGLLSLSNFPGVYSAAALAFYLRTGQYMAPETTTVMPAILDLHKPVLFISGEKDFIAPTEDARSMFAAVPGTQKFLLIVPNAGHNTTYRARPTEYESAVLEFLSKAIAGW